MKVGLGHVFGTFTDLSQRRTLQPVAVRCGVAWRYRVFTGFPCKIQGILPKEKVWRFGGKVMIPEPRTAGGLPD